MTEKAQGDRLKQQIREHYAERAVAASSEHMACCCASTDSTPQPQDERARGLYALAELGELPDAAVLASLGCGNPTALAQLAPGEVVLDLGSGGGIDVLLSARRVGPGGKAYGLDMTDEMLALARENQRQAGIENVEFLKGEIENVPLPGDSVDVIISNCVINLSTDKDRVFAEAFRVLKPGGRLVVSDMVFRGDLALVPESVKTDVQAWAGCVAGALEEQDYLARLRAAGFEDAAIEVTQTYDAKSEATRSGADQVACCCGGSVLPPGISLISGFVRATKPTD